MREKSTVAIIQDWMDATSPQAVRPLVEEGKGGTEKGEIRDWLGADGAERPGSGALFRILRMEPPLSAGAGRGEAGEAPGLGAGGRQRFPVRRVDDVGADRLGARALGAAGAEMSDRIAAVRRVVAGRGDPLPGAPRASAPGPEPAAVLVCRGGADLVARGACTAAILRAARATLHPGAAVTVPAACALPPPGRNAAGAPPGAAGGERGRPRGELGVSRRTGIGGTATLGQDVLGGQQPREEHRSTERKRQ
jgi:hypothetical protein